MGRFLERQGLLERDVEHGYLDGDAVDDDSMAHLHGHSITYRIAMGPQTGRKVFTLQTCSACGGAVKAIARIEDPVIIEKILNHLILNTPAAQAPLPNSRAPPQTTLSDRHDRIRIVVRMRLPTGRGGISPGPGKKLKVQAETKSGKQASERTTVR